ncbi:transport permease protein [Mycolicibacterium madagascariense]|uniref:Transport permease protein n=1 Tax=Mycolicibacterium madagascariense TaxID=212765 RepID=A0A7I7XGM5_9MYCO|nr:ABC transporter permease [Mycolicibacterium madagascariense]MCV7013305.1 ABC transporter permease [Mycolicibacterium madagascariense]BBZ28357.1 transport permease protein [Mycolicibacterium madagascariense]
MTSAPRPPSLLRESIVFAGRRVARWRRSPIVPVQALLLPTLLLITYRLLVGDSMRRLTGSDSLYRLVPMCALAGALFGALALGLAIPSERYTGILSRFWTLPVHRASALLGTLLAEAIRSVGGGLLITAVGVVMGFRFASGWTIVPFVLIPMAVALVFASLVIAVGARAENNVVLTWLGTGSVGLVFCSSGMAPTELFPSWVAPVIRYQPMSAAIETMRALAVGDPATGWLLVTAGWVLGIGAIAVPLAVRGYRIAAQHG